MSNVHKYPCLLKCVSLKKKNWYYYVICLKTQWVDPIYFKFPLCVHQCIVVSLFINTLIGNLNNIIVWFCQYINLQFQAAFLI